MKSVSFTVILLFPCIYCGTTDSDTEKHAGCIDTTTTTDNAILRKLEHNYTKNDMPQWGRGDAVIVDVSFYVESMGNFKVSENTFQLDAYLTMNWFDDRLRHNNPLGIHITDMNYMERVFRPDMYFVNARTAEYQDVVEANRFIHIRPTGFVVYNARVLLSLACSYNLRDFPFDEQHCVVKMMSYSNNSTFMIFRWRDIKPTGRNPHLELSEMHIGQFCPKAKSINYTLVYDTGAFDSTFTYIELEMMTRRRPTHYVLMAILPNAIIVIISWVSFWIDPYATPARVTLCFTSFLTLTTTAMTVAGMLPPVSYLTALSLWSAISTVFVFGTMFEFAIVYNYCMKAKALKEKIDAVKPSDSGTVGLAKLPMGMRITSLLEKANRIDKISRVLFPVLYMVFVTSFASVYIYRSLESTICQND